MEAEYEATATRRWSEGSLECLSEPLEEASVGSASKGKIRAEIGGREEGDFFCLLDLLKVRQRQSVGGIPLTVEVKFEFSSEVVD